MTRAGLIGIFVLAVVNLPVVTHAQGAGATKAQMARNKSPAATASSTAVTTSREAKEKTCIQ